MLCKSCPHDRIRHCINECKTLVSDLIMVELEPTEGSHEIMKSQDTKKVAVQCTDHEIVKGPLPEQVDNKQDDSDSTELVIGAAEDNDPSIWKKEQFTDNIDATIVTIDSNVKSDFEKIKLVLKSAKEEANEVRKKWQSNPEVESKVDLENEEVENKNKEIVKNNEKCICDKGTWEKEKHEEESLEKTEKEKETDTRQRKKKRRRYPKSTKSKKKRRKHVSGSSEHVDQPNKEMEVPGILSATGRKQGGVKSASSNANTTNGRRHHSTRRHPSGGDSLGSISAGGGCGGEPPTPPEEWKERAPCDGYVEVKRRNRRPSKRLITRLDSHTSLPSAIRHGSQHVLNQSPENQNNQVFSLPPIGIPAPTDLVIENFVRPAFAHIQAQPSFLKWRTHHCQSCKTMQACFRHVHGCKGQLLCDICRKLFDEVSHHVRLCQRSEEDMCGMEFCKEFYEATEQGKEAQFEILAKFAASFYDTELTDIPYPIQRQQSVSVNGTVGAGNDAFDPNQGILSNDLEEDSPTSSDDDDDDNEETPPAHDQKAGISPLPSLGSHGDAPDPRHDTNEQHLSGTANHQPPQSLHQSSSSTSVNPSGSAMPTTQSRRGRMPYTQVNKPAVVDHLTNKQYKTRHELHLDTASAQQYVKAPPMWKQEIDEQEEPSVQRGKVVYGEKRHLRAFLPVLDDLQKQLRNGMAVSEQEEGIIFYMGMKIKDGQYKQGDQYVKVAPLGSGAFGKVYLCKDNKGHFEFVVKMISLEHFSPDEALIWSQMNHPNIVQLLGVIRCGGMIYFFSEYVANMNLKSLVANGRVMGQGEALYHMEQLLNILRYVHSQKVVHRDLKPENILVTAEGRLLLIDWGLAKMVRGEYHESEQNPEGTQHYMAPEVAKCDAYNFAADIWSIMCIGIHLISGLPPWMKRFGNVPLLFYVIGTKSPPLEDIPEDTNEQVRDLLVRGLTVEPEQRPSAMVLLEHPALELAHELQNVEAVSPKQKMKQQLELEMEKIADAPSDGEWRPWFAAADDVVDINLPSIDLPPFSGLTTPETNVGPPNLECQDVLGSAAEDPAGGDYASKQQNMDVQTSGSGFMQRSDLKLSEAAPAFTVPTEFVPPEQEITPIHLSGEEASPQEQHESVVAFKAPSFSLVDPEIESQQPGDGIKMPEYDFSHLAIIRPPQDLSNVGEAEACENDDQESLPDVSVGNNQDINDTQQKDKHQSSAEIPRSSTLPYQTKTSQNQSFEDRQSLSEATNPMTNPEMISIASSVANSSSPAVNDVPSTMTPDDIKQFPQLHGEDGNPSAGVFNTPMRNSSIMSSHHSHSATSTHFPTGHHTYHEEQVSYGSIPHTSVHSGVDLYGPSPDFRIDQDFPSPLDAPLSAQVKGQPEPEQEVPLDVQPGPSPSSLNKVEFSQWTETEVTESASGTKVAVVRETEAVNGDPKYSASSRREVDELRQVDKITSDGKMEEDVEMLQQFAAVTLGGSASITDLLFNAHAKMGHTTAMSTASESTSNVHQVGQSSSMGHFNSQSTGVADPISYKEDTSRCQQTPVEVNIPVDVAATETMTSTDLLISKESNPSVSMESNSSLPKQQGDSVIPSASQMVSEDPQTTRQVQPPSTLNLSSVLKTSSEDPQMSNVQTKPPSEAPCLPFLSAIPGSGYEPSAEVGPASPPKMLREDQPGAACPPPQSAVQGSPYEPFSMCSGTSSDMSLRRSLSRRKMPCCRLAPVFSEACGLCEEEPLNNLHQTNPQGSSQTSQPGVKVADSLTRASSREVNQLLGATVTQDQDRLPDSSTQAKETSSESDITGSQGSQLDNACNFPLSVSVGQQVTKTSSDTNSQDCLFQDALQLNGANNFPPSTTVGHQLTKTSSDTSSQDDLFQDARAMPLSATDGCQTKETDDDVDNLLGGACNLASISGAGQLSADPEATKPKLSADPEATKPSSTSAGSGDDIQQFSQFLTDDDEWRFSIQAEGISGCVLAASTPTARERPIIESTPSDDPYRSPSYLSLGQAASNASNDELFMQLATSNLMQQASCAESAEDQLDFMHEAMDLSFPTASASLSFEKVDTSGVYTSSAPGPSPTFEVTNSIAIIQQQLSTISSSSSIDNGGTKVTIIIDNNQENNFSIRMGRDKTMKDLAVGVRAEVPIGIETFTLQAIDGRPLSECDPVGSDDQIFVIVPDPPDNTWTWRVRQACGTLEYPDGLLG